MSKERGKQISKKMKKKSTKHQRKNSEIESKRNADRIPCKSFVSHLLANSDRSKEEKPENEIESSSFSSASLDVGSVKHYEENFLK